MKSAYKSRSIRKSLKNPLGSTLIEAAMILPIFFGVIGASIDYALTLVSQSIIYGALGDGSRYLATIRDFPFDSTDQSSSYYNRVATRCFSKMPKWISQGILNNGGLSIVPMIPPGPAIAGAPKPIMIVAKFNPPSIFMGLLGQQAPKLTVTSYSIYEAGDFSAAGTEQNPALTVGNGLAAPQPYLTSLSGSSTFTNVDPATTVVNYGTEAAWALPSKTGGSGVTLSNATGGGVSYTSITATL